jgi:hypothetical protein
VSSDAGLSGGIQVAESTSTAAPSLVPVEAPPAPLANTVANAILTVEILRRKLDAAIMAEAWEAVKAIRERIVQAEREEAGNVVDLSSKVRRRDA